MNIVEAVLSKLQPWVIATGNGAIIVLALLLFFSDRAIAAAPRDQLSLGGAEAEECL